MADSPPILRLPALNRRRPTGLLPFASALAAAAACLSSSLAFAAPALANDLVFSACTIGDGTTGVPARCATLSRPLDPLEPTAGNLDIAIARLPARGRTARADPLFLIAGGPGQSALQSFPALIGAFRHANRDRDLILVDQRGTGDSGPLDCPIEEADDDDGSAVGNGANTDHASSAMTGGSDTGSDPGPDPGPDSDPVVAAQRSAERCLEALTMDTRLFTTSVAVTDLEAVRQALELDTINLYGVSYGTRVALHYARRYPTAVRSLILDAVVPPGTPLGPDIAPVAQRALDLVLQRCLDDAACGEAFPSIDARVAALLDELQREPAQVSWEDIADGSTRRSELGRAELAVTLRLLAYSAWGAALLPSMLDDAIEAGHFAPFARQAELQGRTLADTLATGMHYSVICTEDLPFMDEASARRQARDTFLGEQPLAAQIAACERWPRGRIDADFHAPLDLDVPALILSGDADPVTPPDYGERAAGMLGDDVLHIVNTGQGHTQAGLGCTASLMARFLDAGTAAGLSLDCLTRLRPPPFFIDANGARP